MFWPLTLRRHITEPHVIIYGKHVDSSNTLEKETTTVTTEPITDTKTNQPSESTNGTPSSQPDNYTPIEQPRLLADELSRSELRHTVATYIRASLDDTTRQSIVVFAESVIAEVIEAEVADVLGPRFEAMYEGVIAQIIQRLMLKALTQRAHATLAELTKST